MSEHDFERNTDHLLFRTLVLMGGALALGCGGSVVVSGNAAGGGSGAVGGAPQSDGGTSPGGGASPVDAGAADCPAAQWDCSALNLSSCNYSSWVGPGRPEGCVCDLTRPKSVADCRPNENLFCLSGSDPTFTDPQSWDGTRHVQCSCVPFQTSPLVYEECRQECASTYPALDTGGVYVVSCNRPQDETCDARGNCTATPASVLRQDGVVCGCASIVLK